MTAQPFSDPDPPPPVRGCLEACRRCRSLVEAVVDHADRDAYRAIGPHLRHCIDHFSCFLRGIETGTVDYDSRDRDPRLEIDPGYFLVALDRLVDRLARIGRRDGARELTMRQEAAPGGERGDVTTNVERELLFLSSHTIHHIAIMTLLAERAGVEVPVNLGVAFSTASYAKQAATRSEA